MKILCMGSVNLDKVYHVAHIPQGGETIRSVSYEQHWGGKGLNQTIALARSGGEVYFSGIINRQEEVLRSVLAENHVHADFLALADEPTGHAIINVDAGGQNSIVIHGGANQAFTRPYIDQVLSAFAPGDLLLLQNEISELDYILRAAHAHGLKIALNPSPFEPALLKLPLENVDIFLVNEIEGFQLTGKRVPEEILQEAGRLFPHATVVLTLGGDGSLYRCGTHVIRQPIYRVPVVDTTAAGDTFTGYFLSALARGETPENGLRQAAAASAIAVSRSGATDSIPTLAEVQEFAGQAAI